MSQLTCFIVEDDPQALEYATAIIKDFAGIIIIGNASNIELAAKNIAQLRPDFVILDVFLDDGGTAFDFLRLFDTINFKIVFTTSYAKYAIDAFRYSAIDYLLKPYQPEQLVAALERLQKTHDKEVYQTQLQALIHNFSDKERQKKLILKNSETIFVLTVSDILYAKSDNNYTTFYTKDQKTILVSGSLKSYEEKLSSIDFFRVHQSYLIQLKCISSFNKKSEEIVLKNKHAIPVAQSRKQELLQRIEGLG